MFRRQIDRYVRCARQPAGTSVRMASPSRCSPPIRSRRRSPVSAATCTACSTPASSEAAHPDLLPVLGHGLHPGGDRLHAEVRALPRPPHLLPGRRAGEPAALLGRGQRPVGARRSALGRRGLCPKGRAGPGRGPRALRSRVDAALPGPATRASRTATRIPAARPRDQRIVLALFDATKVGSETIPDRGRITRLSLGPPCH